MLALANLVLSVVIAAVVVKYVDGNQRMIQVSELMISDDEDFFSSGVDSDGESCCVYRNCSCHSLDYALANLTSDVLINITTDVTLSSLTEVLNLENISIIGHNNPTVNCKNGGAVHFILCRSCIIQGITWDGCGTEHEPTAGLMLWYSSNITIQNCLFQHSIGQAVVLSEVSGDVNINHCKFVNNTHYRSHGAAIHYTKKQASYQFVLTINNCSFTHNKRAKSLVYIENSYNYFVRDTLNFSDLKFYHNQGVCIYVANHNVYFSKKVIFQNNYAENGAGIYMNVLSTVAFGENSDVEFVHNSANDRGGAIFIMNYSRLLFYQNSRATFTNNTNAAIYSDFKSSVIFTGACLMTFNGNLAIAISLNHSFMTFKGTYVDYV